MLALVDTLIAAGPQATQLGLTVIAGPIGAAAGRHSKTIQATTVAAEITTAVGALYFCYAASLHRFFNPKGKNPGYATVFEPPKLFEDRVAKAAALPPPTSAEIAAKPCLMHLPWLIFVSDRGDALSRGVSFAFLRDQLVQPVASPAGAQHVWLWLTKRPARMAQFSEWLVGQGVSWPDHLVAMTSVTGTSTVGRVALLRKVRARFPALSVEPLRNEVRLPLDDIDWVIVGGQSGGNTRPFHVEWARRIMADCDEHGVAFFLKQLGRRPVQAGAELHLADGHGSDWSEWSPQLRRREVPPEWKLRPASAQIH